MEDSLSSFTHSTLICDETEPCLDNEEQHDTFAHNLLNNHAASDSDDDRYVEMLLQREIGAGIQEPPRSCSSVGDGRDWNQSARRDAIDWILRTRAIFGFRFQTAYLSITYFDRFLFRRTIGSEKTWAIRLLSAACLSLAAKMEECRVPTLSEFEVEEYSFESKVIRRMELLVLNTLEWRMGSVTPFAFIRYFISKFRNDSPSPPINTVSNTVELIMAFMKERNSLDHRPPIIAAAAALMALVQGLTRSELNLKINSISSCGFLKTEDLFSCYNLMQEQEMGKSKRPQMVISPDLSPINLSRTNPLDDSSVTSGINTKRRRLEFNDIDPKRGMPDEM